MPSDTAIQELLYAILKQKDLKDIDWHRVAADPILTSRITNGHAARMRYSRFKKQMDRQIAHSHPSLSPPPASASVPRKPRGGDVLSTPTKHKGRVEKNRSPEKVKRGSVKYEREGGVGGEGSGAGGREGEREGTVESVMGMGIMGLSNTSQHQNRDQIVKREFQLHRQDPSHHHPHPQHLQTHNQDQRQGQEHTLAPTSASETFSPQNQIPTPLASTPRYCIEARSLSPSPSLGHYPHTHSHPHQHHNQDIHESFVSSEGAFSSFGIGGSQDVGLFGEVMGAGFGMQLGGMEEGFGEWDGSGREEGVEVKEEPRWEEAYRHVG